MTELKHIYKVGLWTERNGRVLLCRKHGPMTSLILPGGKFEPGETETECLQRELQEELGVQATALERLGEFVDVAAGTDALLHMVVYRGDLLGEPTPQLEIAELVWFGPEDDRQRLSPSLRNQLLPKLWSTAS